MDSHAGPAVKLIAFYNPSRQPAVSCAAEFAELANEAGIEVVQDSGLNPDPSWRETAEMVVSFGGDGTMLRAAGRYLGAPILGVNLGHLGFMAEYPSDVPQEVVRTVLERDYVIERRTTLQTTNQSEHHVAINDVVVQKSSDTSMVTLQVEVDGLPVADYRADALIVSTATGSTGYSLSSGGPIVAPAARALCLTPVAPHTMTLRPLVIQDTAEVKIRNVTDAGIAEIVCDGHRTNGLAYGEHVYVAKSPTDFKLVRPSNRSYFQLLKKKLLWSQSATDEQNGAKNV